MTDDVASPPEKPNKHRGNLRATLLLNFAIVTGVYIWAYCGFSIIWLYLIVIVLAQQKSNQHVKKSKWRVARRLALGWEKDVILKLHHVPSWVTFPDVDRAEWLNQIIKILWPNVNEYMKVMIKTSIEPSLPNYLEFDKIVIGNVPLRIDGVKVYPSNETTRNTIIMDLDIVYAGDCHITCRSYGIEGGITNFRLHGRMRIQMAPLIPTIPLVGGLKMYFLQEPDIDFNFASATQVLSVAKDTIRNIVLDILNGQMLFPNFYLLQLSSDVDFEKRRHALQALRGILRVRLVEAKELVAKDINGKSDPYVILTLGQEEVRSKTISSSLNPVYNEWFEFQVQQHSELAIQLMDHDDVTKDEKMGSAKIDVLHLRKDTANDKWFTLTGVKSGQVHLDLRWMSLSKDFQTLEETRRETQSLSPSLHNAILFVHIDSAKDLPFANKSNQSLPDSYAIISVGHESNQSKTAKHTSDPTWDESFTFMLHNPDSDVLNIEIKDRKSKNVLGELIFPIRGISKYRNMELDSKVFSLQNSSSTTASITCSLRLLIFQSDIKETEKEEVTENKEEVFDKNEKHDEPTGGNLSRTSSVVSQKTLSNGIGIRMTLRYSTQNETLCVIIHEAINIPTTDTYVKLYLYPGKIKQKTSVIKQNSNPQFDTKFEYELNAGNLISSKLEVLLLTEKRSFNRGNNVLGRLEIDLNDFDYFKKSVTDCFELLQ